MKKNYIKPTTVCRAIQIQSIMTISGSDIPYGGIDTGLNTPGSRYRNRLWDDDEDDWLEENW